MPFLANVGYSLSYSKCFLWQVGKKTICVSLQSWWIVTFLVLFSVVLSNCKWLWSSAAFGWAQVVHQHYGSSLIFMMQVFFVSSAIPINKPQLDCLFYLCLLSGWSCPSEPRRCLPLTKHVQSLHSPEKNHCLAGYNWICNAMDKSLSVLWVSSAVSQEQHWWFSQVMLQPNACLQLFLKAVTMVNVAYGVGNSHFQSVWKT